MVSVLLVAAVVCRAGSMVPALTSQGRLAAACVAEVAGQDAALGATATAMATRLADFAAVSEPVIVDCLSLLAAGTGAVPAGYGAVPGRGMVYCAPPPAGATLPDTEVLGTKYVSPLILNLGSGPVPDVPGGELDAHPFGFYPDRVAWFDMDGDGHPDATEWPGPNAGLLVHAPGGLPAPVLSGLDLIGTAGGYADGFERLAAFDRDADGQVAGAELNDLLVWRDLDGDAVPDASEWLTPAALRLTALNVAHLGNSGSYVADGNLRALWDWWPTYCQARPAATGPKASTAFKASMTGVAPLAGGPDATAFIAHPTATTLGILPYDWLQAIGFVPELSQLVAVDPRCRGILLLDRPLDPPRQVRLWVLTLDAPAGGWRAARYDLPEDDLESVLFGANGLQVLACSPGGMRIYVVQTGQLYGPIQWTGPVGMGFRTAFAPAFCVGTSFYLPGYFHDANGVPLADSLATLKISKTKATLKSGSDIRWLIGDGLPARGYAAPHLFQVTSAKTAVAVSRDEVRDEDVLLAIGGSSAAKGKVLELDRVAHITALSPCAGRVLYLVQGVGGAWEVRSIGTKGKGAAPVVWPRPRRPACIEYGYKGLSAFWELPDWGGNQLTLETADPVAGLGPTAMTLPGPPGTLRVASMEPIFVLQRSYGLYLGLWRPTP